MGGGRRESERGEEGQWEERVRGGRRESERGGGRGEMRGRRENRRLHLLRYHANNL